MILTWQLNALSLSSRRRPGTLSSFSSRMAQPLALSSAITGCRIKPGMTDYTYLVAGLIITAQAEKNIT
jgi:hypothetical protein